MQHSKLAIIVPTMNPSMLADLRESLIGQLDEYAQMIIVGIDVTPEQLAPFEDAQTSVVCTGNRGYAHAVNVGIRQANQLAADAYCIVNDDTYVDTTFVKSVRLALTNHPKSLIGGKIYYAPNHEYHADRYTQAERGIVLWYAGGVVDTAHALTRHRGVDEVDHGQYDIEAPTQFVTGCLFIFDKQVVDKVGMWDESYFLYYEDADYCMRAQKKKIPIYYIPSIRLWHKVSQSTGGSGSSIHTKYQDINRLRWSAKYLPIRTTAHVALQYVQNKLIQNKR